MKVKKIIWISLIIIGVLLFTSCILIGINDENKFIVIMCGLAGFVFTWSGISGISIQSSLKVRKKLIWVYGTASVVLFYAAMQFKINHWPGAAIILITSLTFFTFVWLPLHTYNRFEKWKNYTQKKWHAFLLTGGDLVSIGSVVLGFLFKIQHWPYARYMMIGGFCVLAIGLLAWNYLFSHEIVKRKEAEEKTKQALDELQVQHKIIEEKNKEITDSLHYAKRIQRSLITSDLKFKKDLLRTSKK